MNEKNYYKNKSSPVDGFSPYCKVCTKKKSFKWIENNRERFRINLNNYTKTEKRQKGMRENSRIQRVAGKQKEWRKNNTAKTSQYSHKRSAKNHIISKKEWKECCTYFNFQCAYCGKTWEQNKKETKKGLHREHVDDKGANDLSNCVPACASCNSRKWTFEFAEWYNKNNIVFSEDRLNKILKWIELDHKIYIENY
jgi:5-methylcytosine-specific restriction endonuclease McrA